MSERKRIDLGAAVDDVSRVATGVVGRLLGPKAVGKQELGEDLSVDPKLDRALDKVGDAVGKVLQAVGAGLESHPLDPEQAVHEIGSKLRDKAPPERADGWSALSTGVNRLVGGVGAVAEGVIGKVSGERRKEDAPAAAEPEAPAVEVPRSESELDSLGIGAEPPKRDL